MKNEIFNYNGTNITFQLGNGDVMVNATEMAKPFNKAVNDYLRLPSTNELIKAYTRKSRISDNQLVITKRGSLENGGGTWLHEDIALDFAQWLSIEFRLWCNDKIKELLNQGVATISNDDEIIAQAMSVLQKRLEANQKQVQMLEGRNEILQQENQVLIPKAEYFDKTLSSEDTMRISQIASELGMSAIALNKKLHQLGVQHKVNGQWILYAKYEGKGYTKPNTYTEIINGESRTFVSTVWTQKGRLFIHKLLEKQNVA